MLPVDFDVKMLDKEFNDSDLKTNTPVGIVNSLLDYVEVVAKKDLSRGCTVACISEHDGQLLSLNAVYVVVEDFLHRMYQANGQDNPEVVKISPDTRVLTLNESGVSIVIDKNVQFFQLQPRAPVKAFTKKIPIEVATSSPQQQTSALNIHFPATEKDSEKKSAQETQPTLLYLESEFGSLFVGLPNSELRSRWKTCGAFSSIWGAT